MKKTLILVVVVFLNFIQVDSVAEDCAQSTRQARCSSIFENLTNCFNATFKPMLADCLVTCNACESYTCSNPLPESLLNCSALASQCETATFSEFMKEKCPATCGKCNRENADLCSDKSKSEVCIAMERFCNSVDYYDLLSAECPSTCNRCPNTGTTPASGGNGTTTTCQDTAHDCTANKNRCSQADYAPLMHRLCPKTCNACQVCEDNNRKCPTWVTHGFCTLYSAEAVKKTCAKSCNRCN